MNYHQHNLSLLLLLLCIIAASNSASARTKDTRICMDMNTHWAFYRGDHDQGASVGCDDAAWIDATLPHIMQMEKKHCGGNSIYDGIGWYRRHFRLPKRYRGKRIAISFEGVMHSCEVYINGHQVGSHRGGYLGFTIDISDHILWDKDNLIAVRVSAEYDPLTPPGKPQDRLDFYYYSGIYRDVTLTVTDKLHITDALEADKVAGGGVFVTFPKVNADQAVVEVRTDLKNGHDALRQGTLVTRLKAPDGQTVSQQATPFTLQGQQSQQLRQSLTVPHPRLWHPYHPDLYQVECVVMTGNRPVDTYTETVGIRTIRYTAEGGLSINGEPLYIVGANRHQSFPYIGDAAANSMQVRDVINMKRGGYNAVRAAHYPQDPAFLSACDKYGLLVVECIPGWQYFNEAPEFSQRLYQMAREMIRRDRNHPSIILWETALNETHYPLSVVKQVYDIAHEEYPGDQLYTAGDYFSHEETLPYYDVFYKQVARFPKDGNVMSNYPEDQLSIKPLFTREWGDGVGEKPRVRINENEEELFRQCRGRFDQLCGHGYFDWCMLDANPRMGGHFLWSYNDYNRGAEDETMFCGVTDVNRYPKPSYYMMQSMRPSSISQPGLYSGPMVHIASSNSSANHTTSTTAIPVFSNCDEVVLYRNGQRIGSQRRTDQAKRYGAIMGKGGSPLYLFDAGGYESGELKAEGRIGGQTVATHSVRTPGTPHHVEVCTPLYPIEPVADGSDMIPIYIKICDRHGSRINTSDTQVSLSVEGEGYLMGDGIRRIGINPQLVEGGIGYVLVRTTEKAGRIIIRAEAEGLEPGELTLHTAPFIGSHVEDGKHAPYSGDEEAGVVVKPTRWDRQILTQPQTPVARVDVSSEQAGYGSSNIIDGNDFSWWIAGDDSFPQTVTLTLPQTTFITASRIRFQKDSSAYRHRVETSEDGQTWQLLYERECTGWDFKPIRIGKPIRYLRLTIDKASEGRAGLAEITLFQKTNNT